MSNAFVALAVFVAAAALDYAAARYTRSLVAYEKLGDRTSLRRAARWSVAMALLSAVGLFGLVDEPAMLVPECLGLYVGTILSGSRGERGGADALPSTE